MNIGRKLILSFLLVTLVPTILLAFLTTSIISSSKKDDAKEALSQNLKAAYMQYYARARQMQYGMLQASTEHYIRNAISERDKPFLKLQLKAWKEYRPHVDLWAIVDSSGVVIASNNTHESGMKLSINGLVEKAVEQREPLVSTEIVPDEVLQREHLSAGARVPVKRAFEDGEVGEERADVSDGMFLMVVTPVSDEAGEVLGAIVTGDMMNNDTFVPDTFAEVIPGSLVSIVQKDVQISTNLTNDSGQRVVGHVVPPEIIEDVQGRLVGFRGDVPIAGRQYIAAVDPIVNHRGEVVGALMVGVPKDKFLGLLTNNVKAIISISLVALFLASGVASYITYRFTRPIKYLTSKSQLIAAGDLNIRTGFPTSGNDEIAELAEAFQVMVRNLRDNEQSIRLSQEQLSQQKNLIESIINSLPYCLYVIERGRGIVAWNRHSHRPCSICKCSPGEDYYNMDFIRHLSSEELGDGLASEIEGVFSTLEPVQGELKLNGAGEGGKDVFLRTTLFPILAEKGEGAHYVVWMAEDITEKKEMEATVLSSEKLAAVGQLAAGVAHEVNNPLGGILNCLYNFRKMNLSAERQEEYLGFMEDGLKRVQNIVRQLLDFSQQHEPELGLTDINAMIEDLAPLFRHSLKDREVRLVTHLGYGLPQIPADKHQIEQILVNLVLNAVQSVDYEGMVEISTRFDGGWYLITVADTGCGIPPENLQRVFDPFFTTKGVGKGTGLGLSVSRGIIERHRGRIEVESRVGEGTTFKVYLPLKAEEAPTIPA